MEYIQSLRQYIGHAPVLMIDTAPVGVSAMVLPADNISMTLTFLNGLVGVVDYLANGDKSFPKERV